MSGNGAWLAVISKLVFQRICELWTTDYELRNPLDHYTSEILAWMFANINAKEERTQTDPYGTSLVTILNLDTVSATFTKRDLLAICSPANNIDYIFCLILQC